MKMNEILRSAAEKLYKEIGQDRIMALATRNGNGVANRTVNVYNYNDCFYFVTEVNSNKYRQITQNNQVALSVDAIQITGYATPLEHPGDESNRDIVCCIEESLPQQFARYANNPVMRLIKIEPVYAAFISLETGEGFIIDFSKETAVPVSHEM